MQEIVEAIQARRILSFTYKNKKRKAEVYALGVGPSGDLMCRAYEVPAGDCFKLFKVDLMKNVKLENQKWFYPRAGYNPDGDKSMSEVLFKF